MVTYEVLARVANPELLLRPGMTATADVISAVRNDVLLVPNGALRFTPADAAIDPLEKLPPDQRRIWLLEDATPRPLIVTIGLSDGRLTEVSGAGLAAGAQVIVDIQRETPAR
ncbi:hypothetical protein D3874_09175 [Oleomonas cavernae]|uniref:Efflux RND transporter periplasmic adaptor subunit n=1 Tax=Oleomonas cavernae TaxID=2320859 RepID=A0A418WAW7_9PROT|nr:hypothetical protein [Oleomonas cavernae]RJF87177.1 hypothetical protein D3874_09175 [Oleomonas cavernae]